MTKLVSKQLLKFCFIQLLPFMIIYDKYGMKGSFRPFRPMWQILQRYKLGFNWHIRIKIFEIKNALSKLNRIWLWKLGIRRYQICLRRQFSKPNFPGRAISHTIVLFRRRPTGQTWFYEKSEYFQNKAFLTYYSYICVLTMATLPMARNIQNKTNMLSNTRVILIYLCGQPRRYGDQCGSFRRGGWRPRRKYASLRFLAKLSWDQSTPRVRILAW